MKHDPRMKGFRERVTVEFVENLLRRRLRPLPPEQRSPVSCFGRTLATAVDSPVDLPGFDRSAMDGYAVRGEDSFGAGEYAPIKLKLIGRCAAGETFDGELRSGECVKIMTGAPLPRGANAVVPVEFTRAVDDSAVEVTAAVSPLKHVSRRGEDVRAGSPLLNAGRVLRPQDIALLVAAGISTIAVFPQPRIDLVTTGNELLSPGSQPVGAQVVDANTPMLEALVARDGGELSSRQHLVDDPEQLRQHLEGCGGDVIVISGGSSVGEEDHVPSVVAEMGELAVHGIAMRPSSPTGVGFVRERPVFLLPGNPVSCLCAYDFFVGPSLQLLGGRAWCWPYPTTRLPLAEKLASVSGRVDYARVTLRGGQVYPLMTSGASILSSLSRADGVVVVPHDLEGIAAGVEVEVFLYDEHWRHD